MTQEVLPKKQQTAFIEAVEKLTKALKQVPDQNKFPIPDHRTTLPGLAISKDWYNRPIVVWNKRIAPGEKLKILSENSQGIILTGYVYMTSPDLRVRMALEGPLLSVMAVYEGTARGGEGAGFRNEAGGVFHVTKYNPITSLYVVTISPQFPLPYSGTIEIHVTNEGTYPAVIPHAYVQRMIYTNTLTPLDLKVVTMGGGIA